MLTSLAVVAAGVARADGVRLASGHVLDDAATQARLRGGTPATATVSATVYYSAS